MCTLEYMLTTQDRSDTLLLIFQTESVVNSWLPACLLQQLTTQNFLYVLQGNAEAVAGVGSGKVISGLVGQPCVAV